MADQGTTGKPSDGIRQQADIGSQCPQRAVGVERHGIQQRHLNDHTRPGGEGRGHNAGAYRGQGVRDRTVFDRIHDDYIRAHLHGYGEEVAGGGHGHEVAAQRRHGIDEHTSSGTGHGHDIGPQQLHGENTRRPIGSQYPPRGPERDQPRDLRLSLIDRLMALSGLAQNGPRYTEADPFGLGDPNNPGSHRHFPGRMDALGTAIPAHSLVRPDGVQFPVPFEPGRLVNPLFMHALSSMLPGAAFGPSNPQENMIDHPAHRQGAPMPRPHGYFHPGPRAPDLQHSSPAIGRVPVPVSQIGRSQSLAATPTPVQTFRPFPQSRIPQQPPSRGFTGVPAVQNPDQLSGPLPQERMPVQRTEGGYVRPFPATQASGQSFGHSPQSRAASVSAQRGRRQPFPTGRNSNGLSGPSPQDMVLPAPVRTEERSDFATVPTPARPFGPIQRSMPLQPDPAEREALTPAPTPRVPELGSSGRPIKTGFDNIRAATAKCDVCNKRNSIGLTRCISCGWQSCHSCTVANGCSRHHIAGGLHHMSPITESQLIPLPQRRQVTSRKRKADESSDQAQAHTRETPDEASERQPDTSRTTERHPPTNERGPANSASVAQARGGRAKASANRKPAERKATAPKSKAPKTTKPKSSKEEKPKAVRKPAPKKAKVNSRADEGAQVARSAGLPPLGSSNYNQPSDAESATTSVEEGAHALCEYSRDAFRLYGEGEPQTQAHTAPQTTYAPHQVGGVSKGMESSAATTGQTTGAPRQVSGSSQRIASSSRTTGKVTPTLRQAVAGPKRKSSAPKPARKAAHAPCQTATAPQRDAVSERTNTRRKSQPTYVEDEVDDDHDEDYDNDLNGSESDESSTDGYAARSRPQMLWSKPPGAF